MQAYALARFKERSRTSARAFSVVLGWPGCESLCFAYTKQATVTMCMVARLKPGAPPRGLMSRTVLMSPSGVALSRVALPMIL